MAKKQTRQQRLADAAEKLRGELEEVTLLKDELEQWRDGMEGTNLENSATYEKLNEAIDELDSQIQAVEDAAEAIENLEVPLGFGRD